MGDFLQFVSGPLPGTALAAKYDPWLVALSYFVASLAAFTAVDLAGRVSEFRAEQRRAAAWLAGGGFAMGAGIWSMHFVAMLAYQLPIPVRYEIWTTLASMVAAIITSGFALYIATRGALSWGRLAASGAVMGAGIVTMHYTGMYAMRLDALVMYYPAPWLLSIANAIVCSTIAIWLVFHLGRATTLNKTLAALVMGVAICGMHYTGMYATVCVSTGQTAAPATGLDPVLLAATIGVVTLLIMSLALTVSLQSQLMSRTLRQQNELLRVEVERQTRQLMEANLELRGSEARKGAMLESALDCVICMDSDGHVTEFNPAAEATFGHRRAEVLGRELAATIIPERMRESHRRGMEKYRVTGEGVVFGKRLELPALRADGSEFPVELAISAIQADGKPMFAAYLRDITERMAQEEGVRRSLREKELLLGEVVHRVKNNLQVIDAMLEMQARRLCEGAGREAVLDSKHRIRAMALIHQLLYHDAGGEWVDFHGFLDQLLPALRGAAGSVGATVEFHVDAVDLRLPIGKAIPCGLIVNELVSNALKHGFPAGGAGNVWVELARTDAANAVIAVRNDGTPLADANGGGSARTLGLTLVELLAGQLGGRLAVERARPVRFAVTFPRV